MQHESLSPTETCVVCQSEATVSAQTDIHHRLFFVTGVGQLCRYCWQALDASHSPSFSAPVQPNVQRSRRTRAVG